VSEPKTVRASLRADTNSHLDRRGFLRVSAAAASGLLVSLYVDGPARAQQASHAPPPKSFPPDAFVHIRPDGRIVITVNRVELGQGVHTALPMILAEELDADWSQVSAELAPAADVYKDPVFGLQMVGGSTAIANSFKQYRELGAKTRAMLVATAAAGWGVAPAQCRTLNSVVYGPDNQSARYATLAKDAARQPVPDKVALKNPSEFRLIGQRMRRLDGRAKCDGSLKFGLDLDLPGMLIALIARPPVFGARVKGFDDGAARRIAGVRNVFEIPLVNGTAVAIVAERFWAAKQARDRLQIDWDLAGVEHADSSQLLSSYKALAHTAGNVAVKRGDEKALDGIAATSRLVAEYEFPYLAHTPMEPLNATVRFDGDRAEAWIGTQSQTADQIAIAQVLGLRPEQVVIHTEFAGGGFGRRGTLHSEEPREAAAIAKQMRGVPVKLIWTREDDVQGGHYRPMFVHRVEVGIGPDGMPAAWRHVVVGQSFLIGSGNVFEPLLVKNGLDVLVVEGTANNPYAIPNFHLSAHHPKVNVPVLAWRSVGYTHNAFVMETLIDELAVRAGTDPIAYRLKLLNPDARKLRAALNLLKERAAWRDILPPNRAAGIACSEYHDTAVACAVEVSIEDQRPRIHRATVAIECGLAVNPLTIEAQVQGGLAFGVTQLMAHGAITLQEGCVQQRNFDGFTPPYIADAPLSVDVHIVPSTEAPTGVGEPPVPVISPAVVNALARLTGKRYRALPLVAL
jgi:isoquinoline 1-oxidoreductase beta subunit